MWYLRNAENGNYYYLKYSKENLVSRNAADLILKGDKSISRKHATICIDKDTVTIEDHGSTYGTYLNGDFLLQKKIIPHSKVTINEGDVIKFGYFKNDWVLCKLDISTCASTLKLTPEFKKQLSDLGVSLFSEWNSDCTCLTMPFITLTVKVVLALVHQRPIVTPEYWSACLENFNNNQPMPDHKDFQPKITEVTLNQQTISFLPNEKRCSLFLKKSFVFFSRVQMNYYYQVITEAKGRCLYLKEVKLTPCQLCSEDMVVVKYSQAQNSQASQLQQTQIEDIVNYMSRKNFRVIPDSEIGLAVLYASIDKYCNPTFSFTSILEKPALRLNAVEELAPETQDLSSCIPNTQLISKKVDETAQSSMIESLESSISDNSSSKLSVKCERSTKKPRSLSPNGEEPPRKKGTDVLQSSNGLLSASFNSSDETTLLSTNKSTKGFFLPKRKRRDEVSCKEAENLFNFLPDDFPADSLPDDLPIPPKQKQSKSELTTKEIFAPNSAVYGKRKHDGSDTPDGKREKTISSNSDLSDPSTNSTETKSFMKKIDVDSKPWISSNDMICVKVEPELSKHTKSFIKDEIKLEYTYSEPQGIIVIISEDLIKKECVNLPEESRKQLGKNFKKFVKTPHLRRHSIITTLQKVNIESINPIIYESDNSHSDDEF